MADKPHLRPSADAFGNLVWLGVTAIVGSLLAVWLHIPVPLLTGPTLVGTGLSLAGVRLHFPARLRDALFLAAGVTIGAGVSRESLTAVATWPMAFVALAVALYFMMRVGRWALVRVLGTDRGTALLASTPGHLSFVIAVGEETGANARAIVVIQAVRLLSLSLLVPLAAVLAGIETGIGPEATGDAGEMSLWHTGAGVALALALVPPLRWLRAPAPIVLAGMVAGAAVRLALLPPGGVSHWIAWPTFALMGTLIGTQFAGITVAELRHFGTGGLVASAIATVLTIAAALLAQPIVGMPMLHILIAFAPGGLETMAVMGSAVGANPGFVAAAHVGRLLLLSALVPLMLAGPRAPHRG